MGRRGTPVLTLLAPVGSLEVGAAVALDRREAHHGRVRRAGTGATVRLVDGAGREAEGRFRSSGDAATVEIEWVRRHDRPAETTVAVGAGDRERFGWMVEKLTELAVTRVVPLTADRAAGVATRLRDRHLERMRQRSREALKQCGATWAPDIMAPLTPSEFAEQMGPREAGDRWLARAGALPPTQALGDRPVVIVIGPEGGWTEVEDDRWERLGFHPVGLSPYVLRFETAAIAGATLVAALRQA